MRRKTSSNSLFVLLFLFGSRFESTNGFLQVLHGFHASRTIREASASALFGYSLSSAIASAKVELTAPSVGTDETKRRNASQNTVTRTISARKPISTSIPSAVTELGSVQEVLDFIRNSSSNNNNNNNDDDDDDDSLQVVNFHAKYCKVCQRVKPKYAQLANVYTRNNLDTNPQGENGATTRATSSSPKVLHFASVEASMFHQVDSDASLLASLGVTRVPFVQIYRNGQCVASFGTGPSHSFSKRVGDTLELCVQRSLSDWDELELEFASEIQQNRQAQEALHERYNAV